MLKRQRFHHQVAMAGQVKDAITGQGISGAVVKIIDAPDEFINFVIFQTKVLGLGNLPTQWYSLNSHLNLENQNLNPEIQEFGQQLRNPYLKTADKLQLFQDILDDNHLSTQHKFQAFQEICDYLPNHPKTKQAQLGRTQTISDGWFYFMDLPDGVYQLEAYLTDTHLRYTKSQCQVTISAKNAKNINIVNQNQNVDLLDNFNILELKLMPTTLLGKITSADDSEAICMAKVQIQGSENYTFSCKEIIKQTQGEWNYRLVGIAARNTPITVIVSAQGYTRQQKEINLQTGEIKSLNFQLNSN